MTDDMKALIAEAREWRETALPPTPWGDKHIVNRLADALEAAQVPATDDEREALADLIRDSGEYVSGSHAHDEINPYRAAYRILAAGFRRSSRVPVSRDELARAIKADFPSAAAKPFAECVLENFDVYRKADRKAADSGEAGR